MGRKKLADERTRSQRYEASKRASGEVRVSFWLPAADVPKFRRFAADLLTWHLGRVVTDDEVPF